MGIDIKNFYLGNTTKYYQYLRVQHKLIPDEVMEKYKLNVKPDGHVCFEIRQGMYCIKESVIIEFKKLILKILPFRYQPMKYTPGLWKHNTHKTTFVLCLNDFGV